MIASDASPLICLAKAGKLSLLREMFGKVVIEEEVKRETIDRGKEEGAPDASISKFLDSLTRFPIPQPISKTSFEYFDLLLFPFHPLYTFGVYSDVFRGF